MNLPMLVCGAPRDARHEEQSVTAGKPLCLQHIRRIRQVDWPASTRPPIALPLYSGAVEIIPDSNIFYEPLRLYLLETPATQVPFAPNIVHLQHIISDQCFPL